MANGKKHGSALDKSLAVLEAIVDRSQPVALPELTVDLGLPRQTIHRILQQLESQGMIIRDLARDQFAIGPRLSQLALSTLFSGNQGAPVRAILQDLVNDTQETCNIGVLDGLDFIYLERIEGDWPLRVHLQAGSRVPAHCTSGGKVLLAWLPTPIRRRLLKSAKFTAHTANSIIEPEALQAELNICRNRGYATNNEEHNKGIIGIAVPVFDRSGRALAALACQAPAARISLELLTAHIPRLQRQARRLSEIWTGGD